MAAPKSDRAAIRQVIRALKEAGYVLNHVEDGGANVPVWDKEREAIAAIMAVDDAYLVVAPRCTPAVTGYWVRFVMGNGPEDVIADHTLNLNHVLGPLAEGWWG